jgi:hypothetical protein
MKQITVEFLTPMTKTFTVSDKKAKIISILAKDEEELTQEEKELVKDYDIYDMIEKELKLEIYNICVKSIDNKIQ